MAIINLLPYSTKHPMAFEKEKVKFLPKLPKISWVIPGLFILSIAIVWLGLSFQVKTKEKIIASLNTKLLNLKLNSQKIETLNRNKKELNEKLSFYEEIFGNPLLWSEKFSLINVVIPEQIWLTSIYAESKPQRLLVIKGCATSLVESEIISAVSQFAERLKKESSFYKDFSEIKLGPIFLEKRGNLNVMNFSLICKFK